MNMELDLGQYSFLCLGVSFVFSLGFMSLCPFMSPRRFMSSCDFMSSHCFMAL